jgi:hypothetical protein
MFRFVFLQAFFQETLNWFDEFTGVGIERYRKFKGPQKKQSDPWQIL